MTDKNETVIALLGQPNSGKSTLFNALTGLKQHVGNWPGKTVEKKEGSFEYNGKKYLVADLPGTYSLSANSDEEIITRDYIASGKADVVCILADSSQLQRSLFMLADYAGITVPVFLLLNMSDVAAEQGKTIDADKISQKLGIPVVLFSAQDKKNYDGFYKALTLVTGSKSVLNTSALEAKYEEIEAYKKNQTACSGKCNSWLFKHLAYCKSNRRRSSCNCKNQGCVKRQQTGAIQPGDCRKSYFRKIKKGRASYR